MMAVSGSLLKALDARKEAAASPSSNLAWTTGKISWLKFTSNVLQNGEKSEFQSLGGDMASTDNLYDQGSRSVPTPGVISATIKHTGTLKTLKKIEVSYKCWSVPHLEEIEKLFMSLGKTVVLEYGWSKKPDGTPVSSILTEAQFKLSFADFIIATDVLAKTNQGSYGAEKGVVSNFSWTANDDGSYDCSTSFISPSEMMMSQESQSPGTGATCCKTSDSEDGETNDCKKDSDITIKLKHVLNSDKIPVGSCGYKLNGMESTYYDPNGWTLGTLDLKTAIPFGFAMEMDKDRTEEEKKDVKWWQVRQWSIWGAIMTEQRYVTWAYFEENVLNDALQSKAGQPNPSSRNNFGTDAQQAPGSYRDPKVNATTRFDCRMTKIANPKKTTSSDPAICMIPGQPFWLLDGSGGYVTKTVVVSGIPVHVQAKLDKNDVNDFNSMEGYNHMPEFAVKDSRGLDAFPTVEVDPITGRFVTIPGTPNTSKNLGWLSHICLNLSFLIACAEESTTSEELVNKVLDGINSACGNPWEFVITPLPTNPLITTVVDVKALGGMVDPYPLNIQGNNTIVRTATIDTNVSNDIKAQIMYGSNAKSKEGEVPSEFSLFGMGLTDRTEAWNNQKFELQQPCEGDSDADQRKPDDPVGELKQMKEAYADAWHDLTSAMTAETISTMKSTVKSLQLYSPYEEIVPSSPPMLPINLKLTLDGIHGFKWGHSLTVDPLPARYADCTFMVTGVDHNITKDTWDTSIATVLRMPPIPQGEMVLRKKLVKPISNYKARNLGLSNKGANA